MNVSSVYFSVVRVFARALEQGPKAPGWIAIAIERRMWDARVFLTCWFVDPLIVLLGQMRQVGSWNHPTRQVPVSRYLDGVMGVGVKRSFVLK